MANKDPKPYNPLKKKRNYIKVSLNAAGDGLIIYDMETELVVEANPAACKMHGYPREEFIGLNPTAFMFPESHDVFTEHIRDG